MPRVALGMERWRVRFEGRVQGVGFRATTHALARGRPVAGYVRNEPDGSVLMEAQGAPAELDGLLADIERAMGHHIRSVVREPMDVQEGARGFEVRR